MSHDAKNRRPAAVPVRSRWALVRAAARGVSRSFGGPRLRRSCFTAAALLGGCHPGGSRAPSAPNPFESQAYRTSTPSDQVRVFLVAGGDDIANFAAEVLEQRTLWRKAGLPEAQLACYYAKPTEDAWQQDQEQYRRLAPALASCRRASPRRLHDDLVAAASSKPPFIYLYVTSHGLASQSRGLRRPGQSADSTTTVAASESEHEMLGAAAIGLDGGDGPRLGQNRALLEHLRAGESLWALTFTPRTLSALLARFEADVPKIVVLQACYSGGFIDHHAGTTSGPSAGADALLQVPNLTVLTATAAERPSFGCGSGRQHTYFGGAFNKSLEVALKTPTSPDRVDWRAVFERVAFAVEVMEHVDGQRPSQPGWFSNVASDSTPTGPDNVGVSPPSS